MALVASTPSPVDRPRLLVVEDDDAIAAPLAEGLEREGFRVERARTGSDAMAAAPADLVLLDLGLPDLEGTEVCRRLRSRSQVPIIVLTARGDELDRVMLLELGADDYVVKPFGFRELVARIRAVRRRAAAASATAGATTAAGATSAVGPPTTAATGTAAGPEAPRPGAVQDLGPLRVDRRTRRAFVRGEEVHLTPKEFDLLAVLAEDPGAVHRRDDLIAEVWDEHWWGPTKTLDVHVASLRRKLGDSRWITGIRGVGYRFEVPPP